MAKTSVLLPCLIVLFLITFATGSGFECIQCLTVKDCHKLKCRSPPPTCLRDCFQSCCICGCRDGS
ncbi:hypothetical protein PHAVU_006G067000 [Phaseolus vulgaris]|uniref:Uncharacterized protein n=1 Tax=Phaseolus vulgaris TaxID=3885 RepID=V7BNY8_PHAVU|nr:hypothetical protein PHAVU_006G067000g [Phaseolus vulgaris]ESW18748.1 hypothetical protein PHAVU_006G067000g [Phaseolus vulgaris]